MGTAVIKNKKMKWLRVEVKDPLSTERLKKIKDDLQSGYEKSLEKAALSCQNDDVPTTFSETDFRGLFKLKCAGQNLQPVLTSINFLVFKALGYVTVGVLRGLWRCCLL